MAHDYKGWIRRIDLNLRSKYPYLNTKIYKLEEYNFDIVIENDVENFDEIHKVFNHEIKYITAPVNLSKIKPQKYILELEKISDENIPSNFEGLPFTKHQIYKIFASKYPQFALGEIKENHDDHTITVNIVGEIPSELLLEIQKTADALHGPYRFIVKDKAEEEIPLSSENPVMSIDPSRLSKKLNCIFAERDEKLWFDHMDQIYNGTFSKEDLYFYDSSKTSCLVDFSLFQNANLRNHLLLYDEVYCILPLAWNMDDFFKNQKITRNEILYLIEKGRLKIITTQPEARLDYGFLNEAYQTNNSAIVSRRALAALSAIDLVEMNNQYILNDPSLDKLLYPLLKEIAQITGQDINHVSNFLLWPKKALRKSFDLLNEAGPHGISNYGVNNVTSPIILNNFNDEKQKQAIELEFIFHSSTLHLSHALDATYFPFFEKTYTDYPYAMAMGNMLNFYKTFNLSNMDDLNQTNPSLNLISLFDVNDYISIKEFEDGISSSIIRGGMNSLFSELSNLEQQDRDEKVREYNDNVEKSLGKKNKVSHGLDLTEDAVGLMVPGIGTIKKTITFGSKKLMGKFPSIQKFSEFVEDNALPKDPQKRHTSILTQVNRVARLKKTT